MIQSRAIWSQFFQSILISFPLTRLETRLNRSCSALTNILSFARKNARKEKSIFFLRLVSVPYFSRLDKSARLGIPRGPWPSFPENPELIHRRRSSNFAVVCRAAERNPRCDSPRCAHFPSPRIDLEIHQFRRQYRQYPYADRNGWTGDCGRGKSGGGVDTRFRIRLYRP